jgi:hypothetical protein
VGFALFFVIWVWLLSLIFIVLLVVVVNSLKIEWISFG